MATEPKVGGGGGAIPGSRPPASPLCDRLNQLLRIGRTPRRLVPGLGLAVLMAGSGLDQVMHALGEMRELHVGFHVFTALFDRLFGCLALLVGLRKALLDAVADRGSQFAGPWLDLAVLQRLEFGRASCRERVCRYV